MKGRRRIDSRRMFSKVQSYGTTFPNHFKEAKSLPKFKTLNCECTQFSCTC